MMNRMLCRIIGHKKTNVTGREGHRTYFSHPDGQRKACRRCRRVLKED